MRHATRAATLATLVLSASAAFAHPARAQANPISFGVTAGATKALGDFGDGVDLGYHIGALAQWSGPDLPFGVRLDGVYHRFSVKQSVLAGSGVDNANASITAGTLNGVFMLSSGTGAPITPYLIGGVGFYHLTASATCTGCGGLSVSDSQNKFGLNGGGGLSFPMTGFSAFIEARYHHVFTDGGATSMVPISVGIVFH